jgi:hypothetical protein
VHGDDAGEKKHRNDHTNDEKPALVLGPAHIKNRQR